jgi:hypothetical protein
MNTTIAVTNGKQAEEYRKGRGCGIMWARDYATIAELRWLVEDFNPARGGAYDSSYWRGYIAGAEEVLDTVRPPLK